MGWVTVIQIILRKKNTYLKGSVNLKMKANIEIVLCHFNPPNLLNEVRLNEIKRMSVGLAVGECPMPGL